MNGVHDMGGMQGMGPIQREDNEPVFHASWEGRVYAITRSLWAARLWNLDAWRHEIELMPAPEYMRMSYYEKWHTATTQLLVKRGVATLPEFESGRAAPGSPKRVPALTAETPGRFLNRCVPSSVDPEIQPRFSVGQPVRARNINPTGHTRLPRYVRGKSGTVVRDHGVYSFPDTNAHFLGEKRQHVYSVRFPARELWGASASPRDSVHVDLWDDYLEPA